MGGFSGRGLKVDFLFGFDKQVEMLIWLAIVDLRVIPESDVPIRPTCNDLFAHESNVFDSAFVTRSVGIDRNDWFNQVTFPKQEFSVLRARKHVTVFKLCIWYDVTQFELTEFSNITLKFKTSEGLSDFPEPDVACSTGGE